MDRAHELGLEFCKTHFPGHQALVATHPDGHNKSGNIHVHNMLSQRYQKEQEEQEQKIETCKAALAAGKQTVEDAQKWVELIKQIGVPKELTAELLNALIEKIIVHEATEDDFGFRQQEIEIIFRFVGKID